MFDSDEAIFVWTGVTAVVGVGLAWLSWLVAAMVSTAPTAPSDPVEMIGALITGTAAWPRQATYVGILAAVVLAGLLGLAHSLFSSSEFDRQAKRLRTSKSALVKYRKGVGPILGTVRGKVLRLAERETAVVIAGTGRGKTTSVVVPGVLVHDGPVVLTSNKADVVDACCEPRTASGTVWICDPGKLAGDTGLDRWYWNPLTAATTVADAWKLAKIWERTSRDKSAKADAYFRPTGETLLAYLLLAASLDNQTIIDVLGWLDAPQNDEPSRILSSYADFVSISRAVAAEAENPEKQRAGVYGSAKSMIKWAGDPELRKWLLPTSGRQPFDPTKFATSKDTLILLSQADNYSAVPFVTALTAWTLTTVEKTAATHKLGRLDPPLLAMLDEVANVCPWPELPDKYSHYGSRGIMLCSIFQSPSQIVDGFGETGAQQLRDASNATLFLGGNDDTKFLRSISEMCGKYDHQMRSTSHRSGQQGRTRSYSTQRREILSIDQLKRMPEHKGLLITSGVTAIDQVPFYKNMKRIAKLAPEKSSR